MEHFLNKNEALIEDIVGRLIEMEAYNKKVTLKMLKAVGDR